MCHVSRSCYTGSYDPSDNSNLDGRRRQLEPTLAGGCRARHRIKRLQPVHRHRRGTTSLLRDSAGLPRLARPKGCVAALLGRSGYADRPASLSIHGPDQPAGLIHCATDDSPPTLRVGRNLHKHRRAGGPFVSSTRDRGRGGPLSRSGQLAEVDVTSGVGWSRYVPLVPLLD
jgi:hypothetical protein